MRNGLDFLFRHWLLQSLVLHLRPPPIGLSLLAWLKILPFRCGKWDLPYSFESSWPPKVRIGAYHLRLKVEAMKRRDLYQRMNLLEKINEGTRKAQELLEQRANLQEQRRSANMEASFQRQRLQARKSWNVTKHCCPSCLSQIQLLGHLDILVTNRCFGAQHLCHLVIFWWQICSDFPCSLKHKDLS